MINQIYSDDKIMCYHTIDTVPNPNDFVMHMHDNYELIYFISGNASYLVEGTKYKLLPGDLIISRVGEAHMLVIDSVEEKYERMIINFKKEFLQNDMQYLLYPFNERDLGKNNCFHPSMFSNAHYKYCLNAIITDTYGSKSPENLIKANLSAFLFDLNNAFASISKSDNEKNNYVYSVIEYVNKHLCENISVESISNHFYISKNHLNRVFKEATGSPIWKYVVEKRLISAHRKIKHNVSPGDACKECGFKDYSSFYRLFLIKFGYPPSKIR